MFPLASVNGLPSGPRIVVKNWYRMLYPSTAKVFPCNSVKLTGFVGINFVIAMPMTE